jgi:hypothetical protein
MKLCAWNNSRIIVMPVRNLHHKPFDEGTRDKLELYRHYLREWLPVFINGSSVDILQIFRFFCRT